MEPIIAAMYQLSKGGFTVYFPTSTDKNFVIEDSGGTLSKVLVRKASLTESTASVALSFKYNSSEYLEEFGYCLIVESNEPKVWLIPIAEFPNHLKTLRLGRGYEKYVLRSEQEVEGLSIDEGLKRSIQKKIGAAGSIQQEDLEGILSMSLD